MKLRFYVKLTIIYLIFCSLLSFVCCSYHIGREKYCLANDARRANNKSWRVCVQQTALFYMVWFGFYFNIITL